MGSNLKELRFRGNCMSRVIGIQGKMESEFSLSYVQDGKLFFCILINFFNVCLEGLKFL